MLHSPFIVGTLFTYFAIVPGFDSIIPFDLQYSFFEVNADNITISVFISTVALILACLALYSLLSFNIQKKLKEFGIRKILGLLHGLL